MILEAAKYDMRTRRSSVLLNPTILDECQTVSNPWTRQTTPSKSRLVVLTGEVLTVPRVTGYRQGIQNYPKFLAAILVREKGRALVCLSL
jgi:hypothetical protein